MSLWAGVNPIVLRIVSKILTTNMKNIPFLLAAVVKNIIALEIEIVVAGKQFQN